ncbi:MAG: amino acid adenylation domain-containing protein [Thermoanaerobaculia bacterium]
MHESDLHLRLESSVAVIGLAGRFPGGAGVRTFWENLRSGVESITFFTDEELREAGVDPRLLAKPGYVKACAVLDGIELFDAPFFGLTPREAEITDPQQRLFLECAWETLEDAGYDPSAYRGLIGVYAGVGMNTYLFNLYSNPAAMEAVGRFRTIHGNDKDYLAAWTAYKLDLRGPAVCVQTACSTSLVAIHLACQALLNGECDMALAGGVSFSAHQKAGYVYQEGGIHSPDGHCRPFDARAAGTVGGNGLGIVVLKRLKEALADGDQVHAVVRGTAINNDGAGKVGFTAPSVEGQAAVIVEALALAEVDPASVSYVETHGTGTALGDPIEIAALTEAFGPGEGGRCGIGSVKSNIGHLDTASGVAGFIKTVLALEQRLLPPTLHFERPNPNVDFAGGPFFVVDKLREWRTDGSPRRAGVSSFGIGGTNAHAVLEEAPAPPPPGPARPWHLLALSARTASTLETATANLSRFLEERPDVDLADVAHTLQVGRKAFQHRRIAVCSDARDAARTLAETGSRKVITRAEEPRHRPVAFLFPGQGAQHPGMALGLYREEPAFRDAVDRCCETLRAPLGFDLRAALFAQPEAGSADLLRETRLAQPALFVIEHALATLWMERGVRPEALLGHSVGEYVAACLAGVFTLDDALGLVAERGRLIQELPAGVMLAVGLPEEEVLPLLGDDLSLAAVNGPAACVVSGAGEAVAGLARRLGEAGIEHRSLHTSHAFHSRLMEPAMERFAAAVRRIPLSPPRIPFVSNLTGTWITAGEATDPGYWARHLRQTVRFSAGLATLATEPGRIFLEVGPGDSLSRLARRQGEAASGLLAVPSMRSPREEDEDLRVLLQALGSLWTAGVPVAWDRLHAGQGRRRLSLPTYPFERQRYWVDLKPSGARPARRMLEKRSDVADWLYLPAWRQAQAPPPADKAAGGSWLLFSEPDGPAAAVAERLRQRGEQVTEVFPGRGFSAGEERLTLDPRRSGDYTALFAELRRRGPLPDRIVHLWNLGAAGRTALADLATAETRAFYSLLFLAQALPRMAGRRTRLDIISSGLQRVVGDEEIEPARALLLGPVRVLPRERPDVVCRSLDLATGNESVELLVDELLAAGAEPLVALRGGRRWVQAFEAVRPSGAGWNLRDEGVYLITGGLGGIGLTLAGELARRIRARLVLVSRSGPADEGALRAIRSLEELGAEVLALAADVADPGAMADCLHRAEERFGPIAGVVHAAGVPGGGLIELKDESGAAAVLAPKVRGTLVLDALLGPRPLDFFVLCSSLTAVTGGVGEVDYCAANSFLDAFAQSRASYGRTPVVALAWSAWAEVGMAARTEIPFESPEQRRRRLARAILPAEGIEALGGALALGAAQVVVSPQDLETVIELAETTDDLAQRLAQGDAAASAASHQRPDLPQAYVAPRDELEREIASVWQEVLGLERVGVHDAFAELGGDSLLGIRVLSRLRERLAIEIPLRLLFERPTPAELAPAVHGLRLASRSTEADGGELAPPPLVRVVRDAAGLPLSYGQQRLWFLDRLQPGNPAYHLVNFFRLEGRLHVPVLALSLREIVRRHEVLRTVFRTVDGEPRQVVLAAAEVPFPLMDLSALPPALRQGEARRLASREVVRPFDLESGAPLRAVLLRLEEEVHHLFLAVHHIASDGWSAGVLAQETVALYSAFLQGEPSPLPELPVQYADFAVWQRAWLRDSVLDRQLAYWCRQLAGVPPALDLPTDRPRPAVQSSRGDTRTFAWSPAVAADLQQLGREQGATTFMVLLAIFQAFLYRYTHSEDLSIGCPVANRNRTETENLIGFFVNTLVLRTDLSGAPPFRDLLARARETVLQAQAHQDMPFEKLVEELPERNLARSPLFQVMLVLQTPTRTVFELPGVRLLGIPAQMTAAQFDLTLFFQESAGSLRGTAQYSTDLFDAVTVDRFLGSLARIAEAVAADPGLRLPEIPLLSPAERHQMTAEWNDVAVGIAATPMVRSFELQAAHHPQSVAVIDDDGILTYGDLNRQANRLARHLAVSGVGDDRLVALLADRGRAFLVAILAVFKAGGAYLPLDPHHPPSRWRQILTGSGAGWALAGAGHAPRLAAALAELQEDQRAVLLPLELATVDGDDDANPPSRTWPESLAYVIYTSGSTGTPKGAMVEHRGMLNHLRAKVTELGLNDRDLIAQTASQCFDISVWEFLAALLVGGRVRIFPDETARDPERLLAAVDREGVTILETVPSLLRVMLDGIERREDDRPALRALRWLSPTGEALPAALCRRWLGLYPHVPLLNAYGPTECSDNVSHWVVSHPPDDVDSVAPIGRTMDNFRLYLLDAALALVPVGVPGELFVSGIGVGRGYLKDSAKTAEAFIPDPFATEPGGRLYRTGDRVAWRADGTLQFLGRLDHQVKVRGFRIELGEVEVALARLAGVHAAVVTAQEVAGEKRLVGYVVPADGAELSASDLRAGLREVLPEYEVPAHFVFLDTLPLNSSGKIDRRALPAPNLSEALSPGGHAALRTPAEELLAALWSDLLKVERVGAGDGFFELGGHSLLAARLVSRVRAAFGVEMPLRWIFETPVLSDLAPRIQEARSAQAGLAVPPIRRIPRTGREVLSFAQERLWFLDQLEPGLPVYNIDSALRLRGPLELAALERSVDELVRRHEALRTVFENEQGRPYQRILPELRLVLPLVDLSALPETARETVAGRLAAAEVARPFALDRAPLLRTLLLRLGPAEHVIVLTLHHIVSDGWSMDVLVRELVTLYQAFVRNQPSPLPELSVQYADFAAWQKEWLRGPVLEAHLAYWREQLAGAPHVLELPADRPRPAALSFRGASRRIVLPARLTATLAALGREQGTTLFMTLLSALYVLLFRSTGQADLLVGTPIANRGCAELEPLIGFFANTLVLRGRLAGTDRFTDMLARVREAALGAYTYQDFPFEKIVAEIQPERDLASSPLFQVLFVLQNAGTGGVELGDLSFSPFLGGEHVPAKLDLALAVTEMADGRLATRFDYSTDLFDAPTVGRLAEHWANLLEAAAADPQALLADLRALSRAEIWQLAGEWSAAPQAGYDGGDVVSLIEAQAARDPDAVALVCGGDRLTYGDLVARTEHLARRLVALGVRTEARVGLCMERSPEMIVGLLGVLKAGGAYVPLDPAYPAERLAILLDDSGIELLLTQPSLLQALPATGRPVRRICFGELASSAPGDLTRGGIDPAQAAYVIYTSGSTGRPKGVVAHHGGLARYTSALARVAGLGAGDRVLQFLSISFDAAAEQIYPTLASGASLVLHPAPGRLSPAELLVFCAEQRVTVVEVPMELMRQLFRELDRGFAPRPPVRVWITGGESLGSDLLEQWRAVADDGGLFLSCYGPTETTITATVFPLVAGRPAAFPSTGASIGRPLGGAEAFVLDASLRPVPAGVPGDLYLGGSGVTRGYLDRPGSTASAFLPHPLSSLGGRGTGQRLYRTGDLARWRPDGSLEFLRRADQQVKIRTHRIELGEIESHLAHHPAVGQAVVDVREVRPGDRRLVAWVVPAGTTPVEPALGRELRGFLRGSLPGYMVPSHVLFLDRLPLTPSGKVDRRALPGPDRTGPEQGDVPLAPHGEVEGTLAAIWSQLLGTEGVGRDDDFFDRGGHSLLAIQLVSRLRDAFGLDLPLRLIFERPRLLEMAAAIEAHRQGGAAGAVERIPRRPDGAAAPLSDAQQRLWFLHQLEPGSGAYNLPLALRLTGRLDVEALRWSLGEVVARHEVLRTRFEALADEAVQVAVPDGEWPLPVVDLAALAADARDGEVLRLASEVGLRPFDLGRGPLARTCLLRETGDSHVLLMALHHIAADGWSLGVLVREATTLYGARRQGAPSPLPELEIQYGDFAAWQRERMQGEALRGQLAYWRAQLGALPPLVELPSDRPRPDRPTHRGRHRSFRLSAEETAELRQLCRSEGVTFFMLLLAVLSLLIHRYTAQDDVVVGADMAGRSQGQTEGLIGFFINMLVMRMDLAGDPTFRELLRRCREVVLGAFAHQDVSYDRLVRELRPDQGSQRPLFQVVLNFNNAPRHSVEGTPLESLGLSLSEVPAAEELVRFDLMLIVLEDGAGLSGSWMYSTDLFEPSRIETLHGRFEALLRRLLERPDARLSSLVTDGDETARRRERDASKLQEFLKTKTIVARV